MQGGKHQQPVLDATLRQNGDGVWRNPQSEQRASNARDLNKSLFVGHAIPRPVATALEQKRAFRRPLCPAHQVLVDGAGIFSERLGRIEQDASVRTPFDAYRGLGEQARRIANDVTRV